MTNRYKKYEKNYSEESFWQKINGVVHKLGRKSLEEVLILYYTLLSSQTPLHVKAVIIGALGYFICPIDVIPDVLPIIGYTDDAAVIATTIKIVAKAMVNHCEIEEFREKAQKTIKKLLG
ncbi:MAG: DUF1232 domain-containing protein [Planctomycetaceae bacterium]|jgi:uncharacterized membrane protein YkvA (DUF1232 family)|nr:DUF1232 domain-containing protein [Planctomycetaceae bacterium]